MLKLPRFFARRAIFLILALAFVAMLLLVGSFGLRYTSPCAIALPRQETGRTSFGDTYKPYDCVQLEKADTVEARQRGLSGRQYLAPNSGMLFVFDNSDKQCMWMKDMKFNLDIVWLDADKKIVDLKENVKPESFPESFCSESPALYVIELNAGTARKAGLERGQTLSF